MVGIEPFKIPQEKTEKEKKQIWSQGRHFHCSIVRLSAWNICVYFKFSQLGDCVTRGFVDPHLKWTWQNVLPNGIKVPSNNFKTNRGKNRFANHNLRQKTKEIGDRCCTIWRTSTHNFLNFYKLLFIDFFLFNEIQLATCSFNVVYPQFSLCLFPQFNSCLSLLSVCAASSKTSSLKERIPHLRTTSWNY